MTRATYCSMFLALTPMGPCSDPVQDDAVRALGGEYADVPAGEFHRAGQPCAVCHQRGGKAPTAFTVAGTVFRQPGSGVGVDKVRVQMTDSNGTKFSAETNCVGNFFVNEEQWNPAFPIYVRLAKTIGGKEIAREMKTSVGRDPSCGSCHELPPRDELSSVEPIYLGVDDSPPQECPVVQKDTGP